MPRGNSTKRRNLVLDDLADVTEACRASERLWLLVRTFAGKPSLTQDRLDMLSRELRLVDAGLTAARRALRQYMYETAELPPEMEEAVMELVRRDGE